MFKLYRKSQRAQLNWIRNHPVQYIVLNTIVLTVWIAFIEYRDRQEMRKWQNEVTEEIV